MFRFIAPLLRMENLTVDFVASGRFISYSFWSQFPYPQVAVRAKDVSLETLTRINDLTRANGAMLIVVALPTRNQVYSKRMSGDHYDIDLPQAYVRLFAREANIPFLDLLPPLRAYVTETNKNLFVRGDTHLNNKGTPPCRTIPCRLVRLLRELRTVAVILKGALLHDSTPAQVGPLSQPLVHDTTASTQVGSRAGAVLRRRGLSGFSPFSCGSASLAKVSGAAARGGRPFQSRHFRNSGKRRCEGCGSKPRKTIGACCPRVSLGPSRHPFIGEA